MLARSLTAALSIFALAAIGCEENYDDPLRPDQVVVPADTPTDYDYADPTDTSMQSRPEAIPTPETDPPVTTDSVNDSDPIAPSDNNVVDDASDEIGTSTDTLDSPAVEEVPEE